MADKEIRTELPEAPEGELRVDSQKPKLLMMFCALGLAMCILDLGAGVWLWKYVGSYEAKLPSYDRFLGEVREAGPKGLADIAFAAHAGWEACEEARTGVQETVVHITIAASFVGLALFTLCFLLAFLMYQELVRLPGGRPAPLPPDNVDDIWR
jgi:hypothetical protein